MRKRRNYLIFIIIALISLVIISSAFLYPYGKKKSNLSVDAMYILKNSESEGKVNISAIIYLTNTGGKSDDIKIVAYLLEKWKGIAVEKKEISIGEVKGGVTKEISTYMQIGNGSYQLEVLVFENELLKIKGGGWIETKYYESDGIYYTDTSIQDIYFKRMH